MLSASSRTSSHQNIKTKEPRKMIYEKNEGASLGDSKDKGVK